MALELVLGSSFYHYLQSVDRKSFSNLLDKGFEDFGRAEYNLACNRRNPIPFLISASAAEVDGRHAICLVITDLTEQKQAMARERELQVHLMEQREDERVRIARNLHDGPLQDVLALSYTLQAMLPATKEQAGMNDLVTVRERVLKLAGDLRSAG